MAEPEKSVIVVLYNNYATGTAANEQATEATVAASLSNGSWSGTDPNGAKVETGRNTTGQAVPDSNGVSGELTMTLSDGNACTVSFTWSGTENDPVDVQKTKKGMEDVKVEVNQSNTHTMHPCLMFGLTNVPH